MIMKGYCQTLAEEESSVMSQHSPKPARSLTESNEAAIYVPCKSVIKDQYPVLVRTCILPVNLCLSAFQNPSWYRPAAFNVQSSSHSIQFASQLPSASLATPSVLYSCTLHRFFALLRIPPAIWMRAVSKSVRLGSRPVI